VRGGFEQSTCRNERGGFTLLELMVAAVILAVGLVAVLEAITRSLQCGRLNREHTRAVLLAEAKMAELRSLPQLETGNLEGSFAEESAVPSGTEYHWRAEVLSSEEAAPLLVRITVYWLSGTQRREVTIESLVQKHSSSNIASSAR